MINGVWQVTSQKKARNILIRRQASATRWQRLRPWQRFVSISNGRSQCGEAFMVVGLHQRTIINARKWPQRVLAMTKIVCRNTITDGYCGGAGCNGGYRLIAGHQVVTAVMIR